MYIFAIVVDVLISDLFLCHSQIFDNETNLLDNGETTKRERQVSI